MKDVPYSLDKSITWLEKGKVVEYLRNKKNGYYFVSDGNGDHSVFIDDEFNHYFKLLSDFRSEKIDQIL
jgi:hypothetical protein